LLSPGCGKHGEPPADRPPEAEAAPQLVFAGRPLELPEIAGSAAVLLEPKTNTILYEQNAHDRHAPASIVKMTLELVVMREVEAGRLSLADSIRASAHASKMGGSQVYLAEGEVFTLEEMLQAITIASANDACAAVAEHIAGTTDGFVRMMNQEVEALGLKDTHYINVHGLDDEPGEGNYSSAYDIAQIGRELVRYPHILDWSSTVEAPFRGGEFRLQNTNKLLGHFPGLDGIKTGYTAKAGFCLCASAERDSLRLISVIMGADSNKHRFSETARLLGAGFTGYSRVRVCSGGEPISEELAVQGGKPKTIRAEAPRDIILLVSRPDDRALRKEFVPREGLRAPLRQGTEVGTLRVLSGEKLLAEIPGVCPADVAATGFRAWLKRVFGKN